VRFAFKLSIHGQRTSVRFQDLVSLAVRAEELGFDGVYVIDHLLLPSSRLSGYTNAPAEQPYFLDAWTSLAAIAQATKRVRVGPQVSPIGLRHPVFVAKWAATIDQISEGRLQLQLGAGHQRVEYESHGFPYPKLAERIERLREGIQVIRALWESEGPASYRGEHYVLDDVTFWPKPVQGRPEIWLGGGSATVRRLVAELADGWTPAAPQGEGLTPESFGQAISEIRQSVTDGRHITGGALFYAIVSDDEHAIERTLSILRRREDWANFTLDDFRKRAIVLAGPPAAIVDHIKEYEEQGLEHISLAFLPLDDLDATREMITRVGTDVIPQFA
jgi:probable F420-dependent oxidoreductase